MITLTPLKLGNVFLEGEPVRVGADGSGAWTLTNLTGEIIQRGRHEGAGELSLELPSGERGHYILSFVPDGSKPVKTPLAVLEPYDFDAVADSPFGICTHFGQLTGPDTDLASRSKEDPEVVPLLRLGGFKTHRDELTWKRNEPVRGACVFPDAHRHYMATCGSHGVRSLIILNYNNRHYDGGNTPHTDDGVDGFTNYARRIVRQYGDQLRAVEVWNEFNGSFSKGPAAKRPDAYLKILERTYKAVKAERPDLTVVAPAAVTLPFGWLEQLFKLGALQYIDAVSVHPYSFPRQPDTRKESLSALLLRLQDLIKKYNHGEPKPLQLTELGWPTQQGPQGVSGLDSARYAVRSFVTSLAIGVEKVYWYTLLNTGMNRTNREHNFGLLRHPDDPLGAYTPKPAYVALAVLARQLTGATFVAKEKTPDPVYSFLFERAGRPLRVMWTPRRRARETTAVVNLESGGSPTVTDMMGRVREATASLTLTGSPVYISGEASVQVPKPGGWL